MANEATAYSITRDLVDSYSAMVDIETAIKSRYRLRLERILAEYKKRCINPDDYEFQIAIVNGQAVYTLIERRRQIVKTTVRDQVFKTSEKKQHTKRPAATLVHQQLQTSPVEPSPPSHDAPADALSVSDLPREPSAARSRRRSSSVTYRLHLAEASESDLTYTALFNSKYNNPAFKLSPAASPSNGMSDDEASQHLDLPAVTLPSSQLTTAHTSKLHHIEFTLPTVRCESISEHVESSISNDCNMVPSPTTFLRFNKLNKSNIRSTYPSAITIYKERKHQLSVYGSDRSVSCHPRRAVASLSKVFPQAVFPSPGPYNPASQKLKKERIDEPGLRVVPVSDPVRRFIPESSKSRPSASSP